MLKLLMKWFECVHCGSESYIEVPEGKTSCYMDCWHCGGKSLFREVKDEVGES